MHFYLRNKTVFLFISWSRFSNIDILETPEINIMNMRDVNSLIILFTEQTIIFIYVMIPLFKCWYFQES